ncbi:hypothetical protein C8J55DRAFT_490257 [Lentinula edodes]|uniref:Uncharacterized protein n=1 Tax=Lentinula lateritia TaxID=40482 RepID=A0A9W9DLE4_9AGAR|nr:hypothetical protein C8J55DRAFT_490257 [Lentinula edodes]
MPKLSHNIRPSPPYSSCKIWSILRLRRSLEDGPSRSEKIPWHLHILSTDKYQNLELIHTVHTILETCSGAFRSELVLRTFAFHLTWSLSATKEPAKPEDELVPALHIVYPSGALALATTAVYWALNLRANGTVSAGIEGSGGKENSDATAATPSKTKPKNKLKSAASIACNNENSFGEKFSGEYNQYQAHTSKLTKAKWNLIINASKCYIINIPNSGARPALKVGLEEARTNFSVDDEGGSELDTGIREERRRQDVIMLSDD